MVVLLWIVLCVFVSFPDLFIGAHAKKQGEDLADNDGEEDEGILFGDEVSSMFLNLFGVFFTPPPLPLPSPSTVFEWNLLVSICIFLIIMTQSINTVRVNVNEWGLGFSEFVLKRIF